MTTVGDDRSLQPRVAEDEVDLLGLVGTIWRRKWLVIVPTLLVTLGVVAFALVSILLPPDRSPLPNTYQATALLLVNDQSSGTLQSALASSGLAGIAGLAGVSTTGGYGDLAVKLASGNSIVDVIVKEFDIVRRNNITTSVTGRSRRAVREHMQNSFDSLTNTVVISYVDRDPKFARDVVNRIVALLEQRFTDIGGNRALNRKVLLERKMTEVGAEIARLQDQVQAFQREHGALTVDALATEQVTALAQARANLISKEIDIQTYSEFAPADDPALARLRAQRDSLRKLIGEMGQGYSVYSGIGPAQKDIPALAADFERLTRELDVQVKIYEMLTQQYELTKLTIDGDDPIMQILELADAPDIKSGPSRSIIVVVASMATSFLSVLLVFIVEAIGKTRRDPDRMRRLLGRRE